MRHPRQPAFLSALTALLLCAASCGGDRSSGTAHGAEAPDVVQADTADADGDADAGAEDDGLHSTPMPPLPAHQTGTETTTLFRSVDACAQCHVSGNGLWTDAVGRDISPVGMWQATMMANSARDPYWLAAFAHERDAAPAEALDHVVDTCTRCHAPAANETARRLGEPMDYDALTTSLADVHELGREGVTCTVCHQIANVGLGTPASFTGGYIINDDRQIYGPLSDPFPNPMLNHVNYRPVEAEHVMESAMCATCHTVMTRALDAEGNETGPLFPEQVPYLEWRNSAFSTESDAPGPDAASCQSCHLPRETQEGQTITSGVSQMPPGLSPRNNLARHAMHGGNAWMLEVLAANREQLGSMGSQQALLDSAARNDLMLSRAAEVTIADVSASGDTWSIVVEVRNLSGHRFPTAYPSRRVWVELEVVGADGSVVFHSGGFDGTGAIVGPDGARLDTLGTYLDHVDPITRDTDVTVYETIMADGAGEATHTLLAASSYLKDTRLLPLGWTADHPDAPMTQPVGVDGDGDFVAGGDATTYRVTTTGTPQRVTARLWYQSVPPAAIEATQRSDTPEAALLRQIASATPPLPRLVADAQWTP